MMRIQPVCIPAKRNLVDLFKEALQNEIALIKLQKGDMNV